MEEIFKGVLQTSLLASWGILLVFVFRFFLKRISHTYAYLLWGIVLFRLACPVVWEAPAGLLPSLEEVRNISLVPGMQKAEPAPSFVHVPEAEGDAAEGDGISEKTQPEIQGITEEGYLGKSVSGEVAEAEAGDTGSVSGTGKTAGVVWALGVALFWGAGMVSCLRFRGKLKSAVPWQTAPEGEGRQGLREI